MENIWHTIIFQVKVSLVILNSLISQNLLRSDLSPF